MNRRLTSTLAAHGHARAVEASLATDRIGAAADRAAGLVWRQMLAILREARDVGTALHGIRRAYFGLVPLVSRAMLDGFAKLHDQTRQDAKRAILATLPAGYLARAAAKRVQESRTLALREPGAPGPDEARAMIDRLLFPSPAEHDVYALVRNLAIGGETWEQRLHKAAPPWSLPRLASVIAQGYAGGKSQREIAQDLLPVVDGVRSSARRLARTYGMAVAHRTQMDTADGLGDLVVGYQVHATLDQFTRPLHRARDGQIYYREPGPGQKGMDECPHPPQEADGTTAWNCRCFLTPVLRAARELQDPGPTRDLFTGAAGRLVPDPLSYAEWFKQADVRRQKVSVGAQRYNAAAAVLGRAPAYEDLVTHGGELLPLHELKGESAVQRMERVAKVRVDMIRRREMARQTAIFGFAESVVLVEAGFTGSKIINVRGKPQTWYWVDGKRVAGPKIATAPPPVRKVAPAAPKPRGPRKPTAPKPRKPAPPAQASTSKPAPGVVKVQAAADLHPLARQQLAGVAASIKANKSLTAKQRLHFFNSAQDALKGMSPAALERLSSHVGGVSFYGSHADLKEGLANMQATPEKAAYIRGINGTIGGCAQKVNGKQVLHLDGDYSEQTRKAQAKTGGSQLARDTYAHEFSHAIDGPNNELSKAPEWQAAWKEEIKGGKVRLSDYGKTSASEGFAEFGRAALTVDKAKVKAAFPKCYAYWQKAGLIEARAAIGAGEAQLLENAEPFMGELFGRAVALPGDGGVADLLL